MPASQQRKIKPSALKDLQGKKLDIKDSHSTNCNSVPHEFIRLIEVKIMQSLRIDTTILVDKDKEQRRAEKPSQGWDQACRSGSHDQEQPPNEQRQGGQGRLTINTRPSKKGLLITRHGKDPANIEKDLCSRIKGKPGAGKRMKPAQLNGFIISR